jgi:hypothetical protein
MPELRIGPPSDAAVDLAADQHKDLVESFGELKSLIRQRERCLQEICMVGYYERICDAIDSLQKTLRGMSPRYETIAIFAGQLDANRIYATKTRAIMDCLETLMALEE